ncbi:LOW QUALITY PROTEIN: toll-like receptor 4 [Haliotis rubra]|uniref:LOW QUALITY PROTEIN: toll-like receptor 4 n=1 Tax=Haliotis rubra TaxID=36100 RepID=UPI001EE5BC61|nr:LOW QUALITY PROTEIN: toll-like receptor 4 [Haliotis rubra]
MKLFRFLALNMVSVFLSHQMATQQSTDCKPCICKQRHADCSSRSLKAVPQRLPTDIIYLSLRNNSLEEIKCNSFKNYASLTELDLNSNYLSLSSDVYSPCAFSGLVQLRILRLCGNCDSALNTTLTYTYPDKPLSHATSLEELYIDGIPKPRMGKGFKKLANLTKLIFTGRCNLLYIQEHMFATTPNLRLLNLSSCHIYDIHNKAFSPLKNIHTIDVSGNTGLGLSNGTMSTYGMIGTKIKVLKMNKIVLPFTIGVVAKNTTFMYLKHTCIQRLYIGHNFIEALEEGVFDFYPSSLELLSIVDNRFTVGAYVYNVRKAKGLKSLDMSDMSITHNFFWEFPNHLRMKRHLEQMFHGPPDLENVTVRNYEMKSVIPDMHINLPKITFLDASNNVMTKWIGPIKGLESLKRADLSNAFCSYIKKSFFSAFPNLTFLNISNNLIGDALRKLRNDSGTIFQSLTKIEILDLSASRIRRLHRSIFEFNTKLTYLDLSNNELTCWDPDIRHLKSLKYLDLSQNQILTLEVNFRESLETLSNNLTVDILQNPLSCICDNVAFLSWLFKNRKHFRNVSNYTCNLYEYKIDLTEEFVDALQKQCKPLFGIITSCLVGITFTLSLSVLALLYRYRWRLRYLYYVARDRYRPVRASEREEHEFVFDAFVSSSDEDFDFVDKLVSELEGQGRRLCIHHRDFKPGEPITSNIVKAVQTSRRTLIILSPNFLSSEWCRYEFEMAKMEGVYEARSVILIVKIGEVDAQCVPRELLYMMKTDSYTECPENPEDQATFWTALNEAIAN